MTVLPLVVAVQRLVRETAVVPVVAGSDWQVEAAMTREVVAMVRQPSPEISYPLRIAVTRFVRGAALEWEAGEGARTLTADASSAVAVVAVAVAATGVEGGHRLNRARHSDLGQVRNCPGSSLGPAQSRRDPSAAVVARGSSSSGWDRVAVQCPARPAIVPDPAAATSRSCEVAVAVPSSPFAEAVPLWVVPRKHTAVASTCLAACAIAVRTVCAWVAVVGAP